MTPSDSQTLLIFGKSMGRTFFQKPIFAKFSKKSRNIFGKCIGPILGQNLVKCMGQFSFSSRHIDPTKKILEYTPPGIQVEVRFRRVRAMN